MKTTVFYECVECRKETSKDIPAHLEPNADFSSSLCETCKREQ